MVELETGRLRLREFTLEDGPGLSALDSDPEVMRYIGRGVTYTYNQTEAAVRRMLDHYRRYGYGMYALVHRQSGAVIGRCGFKYWEEFGRVEIGWLLARPFWGQGLAFEAARPVMAYGFQQQNFSELIAIIDRSNLASSKLAEKLGMRFERELDFGYKTNDCYRIDRAEFLGERQPHLK